MRATFALVCSQWLCLYSVEVDTDRHTHTSGMKLNTLELIPGRIRVKSAVMKEQVSPLLCSNSD